MAKRKLSFKDYEDTGFSGKVVDFAGATDIFGGIFDAFGIKNPAHKVGQWAAGGLSKELGMSGKNADKAGKIDWAGGTDAARNERLYNSMSQEELDLVGGMGRSAANDWLAQREAGLDSGNQAAEYVDPEEEALAKAERETRAAPDLADELLAKSRSSSMLRNSGKRGRRSTFLTQGPGPSLLTG